MATAKSVWGIDIGQCALKALKLRDVDGELRVEAFDIIEHPKILSQPDADRRQLIRTALEQFLARNHVAGSALVVSVPGQTSFTRFVKLPPVEAKRVPDIVRFEAEQQIPFPINEVIWRYQTFEDPDSPDVEVGIFAMKRTDVGNMLEHFAEVAMDVDIVQMAPLALYNFMVFDGQASADGATLLADVGANKTDLVIADGARIWTRTIQIGGNNFTEALVRAFKLSFSKAERLKRTAASSKYARQIFQAMRPVFADLVQEIQRSIGYYTSLHRESRFARLVGLGNGFRLPGLQKFLEQNLGIPVARIDSYNHLDTSPAVNAPTFTENVPSFAVAYGLALQGLEQTAVNTNLLPVAIARHRAWRRKRPWFAASAALILASLAGPLYRANLDAGTFAEGESKLRQAQSIIQEYEGYRAEFNRLRNQGTSEEKEIGLFRNLFGYRSFWPSVHSLVSRSILDVTMGPMTVRDRKILDGLENLPDEKMRLERIKLVQSEQAKVEAIRHVSDPAERESLLAGLRNAQSILAAIGRLDAGKLRDSMLKKFTDIERRQRRIIVIEGLTAKFYDNIDTALRPEDSAASAAPAGRDRRRISRATTTGRAKPGFLLSMKGWTPLSKNDANTLINNLLKRRIQEISVTLPSLSVVGEFRLELKQVGEAAGRRTGVVARPAGRPSDMLTGPLTGGPRTDGDKTEQGPKVPDPLTGEESVNDTRFTLTWMVRVEDDGIAKNETD